MGRAVELFKVKLSRVDIGGISHSEIGLFYPVGQGLGPSLKAVRVFYGWQLAVEYPGARGRGWPFVWLKGLTSPLICLLLINDQFIGRRDGVNIRLLPVEQGHQIPLG